MTKEIQIFRDFLKVNNLRQTPQRETILEIFLKMEGHVLPEDLFKKVREIDPSIGMATTYRTLSLLVQSGLARENDDVKGKNYELEYLRAHHDHLICTQCNKVVEFQHPVIEQLQLDVCDKHGFSLRSHTMTLKGICQDCLSKQKSD